MPQENKVKICNNLKDYRKAKAARVHARLVMPEADLTRADLIGLDLRDADLGGTNLTDAKLIRATLTDADLTFADLRRADLFAANLRGANLKGADLFGANLSGADLFGADLSDTDLRNTIITVPADPAEAATLFEAFSRAKYLDGMKLVTKDGQKITLEEYLERDTDEEAPDGSPPPPPGKTQPPSFTR